MKIIITFFCLFPLLALATDKPYTPPPKQTIDNSVNQEQQQQQQQQQTQANEQSVAFSQVRQVASAIAPGVYSANPCYYGKSGAIGIDRLNLGGGKQMEDQNCAKLETARMLAALGEVELAIQVACATESAVAILGEKCKPSTTMKQQIKQLESDNAFLMRERDIDRKECTDSKNRIIESCQK